MKNIVSVMDYKTFADLNSALLINKSIAFGNSFFIDCLKTLYLFLFALLVSLMRLLPSRLRGKAVALYFMNWGSKPGRTLFFLTRYDTANVAPGKTKLSNLLVFSCFVGLTVVMSGGFSCTVNSFHRSCKYL